MLNRYMKASFFFLLFFFLSASHGCFCPCQKEIYKRPLQKNDHSQPFLVFFSFFSLSFFSLEMCTLDSLCLLSPFFLDT
ncbi:hypothetical protein AQUCO_07400029v1 [Aquilegia coerulea]|uniref:Secreted protein n=1 Tax=Aquilegia coerulea TaxID=218851 RepID=A0A2G5CAN2_AQUCA|nr:hypothetical protein AQUCO_07400029v1 [Aquilegia coerulea]